MLKESGLCPANTAASLRAGDAPPVPKYDVTKIRAIFFDLDDTILDFGRAEASALRRVLTEEDIPAGDAVLARYHHINAAQWVLLEEGKLTRPQVLIRRFDLLFNELGVTGDPEAVCARYEEYLAGEAWFVPGAEALLEALAPRYNLYIASNGTAAVQHRRLAAAGIGKYVQKVFVSQEVGADKPSPAFFDACFAAIPGLSRQEALMVGDSLTSDIRGGRNAGMAACWFNPQKKPGRKDIRPDFEIHSLEELPRLLAGERPCLI